MNGVESFASLPMWIGFIVFVLGMLAVSAGIDAPPVTGATPATGNVVAGRENSTSFFCVVTASPMFVGFVPLQICRSDVPGPSSTAAAAARAKAFAVL